MSVVLPPSPVIAAPEGDDYTLWLDPEVEKGSFKVEIDHHDQDYGPLLFFYPFAVRSLKHWRVTALYTELQPGKEDDPAVTSKMVFLAVADEPRLGVTIGTMLGRWPTMLYVAAHESLSVLMPRPNVPMRLHVRWQRP